MALEIPSYQKLYGKFGKSFDDEACALRCATIGNVIKKDRTLVIFAYVKRFCGGDFGYSPTSPDQVLFVPELVDGKRNKKYGALAKKLNIGVKNGSFYFKNVKAENMRDMHIDKNVYEFVVKNSRPANREEMVKIAGELLPLKI